MWPDRVPNKTKHSHQHRVANPRAKANISSRSNNINNQPNIKARAKAVKVANMQAKVAATAQAKFFHNLGPTADKPRKHKGGKPGGKGGKP